MQEINSYRDLNVWREAVDLAEACCRLTCDFPGEEMFGMTAQIRRAAVSIPANIAEGHGLENTHPFIQHLRIAQGSLKELETHQLLARRVGLVEDVSLLEKRCGSIGSMLRSLIRSLQRRRSGVSEFGDDYGE